MHNYLPIESTFSVKRRRKQERKLMKHAKKLKKLKKHVRNVNIVPKKYHLIRYYFHSIIVVIFILVYFVVFYFVLFCFVLFWRVNIKWLCFRKKSRSLVIWKRIRRIKCSMGRLGKGERRVLKQLRR